MGFDIPFDYGLVLVYTLGRAVPAPVPPALGPGGQSGLGPGSQAGMCHKHGAYPFLCGSRIKRTC